MRSYRQGDEAGMGERSYVPFDVFAMRVEVPVSSAVRVGDLGWTCGQCPLTQKGDVFAPHDLLAQTEFVCDMIEKVTARAGFATSSIGRLHVYLTAKNTSEARQAERLITARFDHGPLIVPIYVPHFYYAGMLIEVDVFAAADMLVRTPYQAGGVRLQVVEAGDEVWAYAEVSLDEPRLLQDPAELIAQALKQQELDRDYLLSDIWMISGDDTDVREIAATAQRLQLMTNPDAVLLQADPAPPVAAAMLTFAKQPGCVRKTRGTADGLRLVLNECGRMIRVTGSCADSGRDLVAQTSAIMDGIDNSLRAAGGSFADVVKLTAHYTGGASEQELHGNMKVRHRFYSSPGPASTGLPVQGLGNDDCRIAIDVMAML